MNKKKIINDPIYGFISVPFDIVFDLIEHPFFQRLRRIKQLGLTHLVYPGANHTRFHHALGAMHLMTKALDVLTQKGVEITEEERKGACIAILLHDIGHGPFSHTLESNLIAGISHEQISIEFIHLLNKEFNGELTSGLEIYMNRHPKPFLHELVSSQLDVDRLDYLTRDSFYTGVSEGIVGLERIIQMLNVKDNRLVVEEKGIYSIEKFLVARRLMYWQVYLHKTTIAADTLLVNILKRARFLVESGEELFGTTSLLYFLDKRITHETLVQSSWRLRIFSGIDDFDVIASIKEWSKSEDKILSYLCECLINRRLPKVKLSPDPISQEEIAAAQSRLMTHFEFMHKPQDMEYLLTYGSVVNEAYGGNDQDILILKKDGTVMDIAEASDNYNIRALRPIVEKFFICAPK